MPLNHLLREHSEQFKKYAARFGLSPADRAELDTPADERSRRERLLAPESEWSALAKFTE
jgi:hypothetical protein